MHNPLLRFSRDFIYKETNKGFWQVIDGADNVAGKIELISGNYETSYVRPSIRFMKEHIEYSYLGNYGSIDSAKKILTLHEKCETKPIFIPGGIKGWIDKEGKISLIDNENIKESFFKKIFKKLLFIS